MKKTPILLLSLACAFCAHATAKADDNTPLRIPAPCFHAPGLDKLKDALLRPKFSEVQAAPSADGYSGHNSPRLRKRMPAWQKILIGTLIGGVIGGLFGVVGLMRKKGKAAK